ncbi:MAG: carboxypeptidase-like regulatory domain-containing protein [Mucilaginibacter sp.]
MRFPWLIIFVLLFPLTILAQNGVITGTVTTEGASKPLPRASVFLSNSSVGTATAENGTFSLRDIRPGQYTLVVTILGYENYTKTVLVGREPIKMNIELTAKPLMLREVVISSAADWKKNYEAFKKEFIGTDENAKYCTVVNPHILNLTYNPTKQILHADADEFLVVENKALGYRVKYLLNDFKIDKISGIISRQGQQVFEELHGSEAQKKKWHLKRDEAYYGSAMHFYRSLYTDKLAADGFMVYTLKRSLNPARPPEDMIKHKIKQFYDQGRSDSLHHWNGLANLSRYAKEKLNPQPLQQSDVLLRTQQQGIYAIHFTDYLYVVYTKKRDEVFDKDLYRPLDMPNYETTVITLYSLYALFDMNGIIVDNAPLYEGAWAKARLSDLLPVDYVPDVH